MTVETHNKKARRPFYCQVVFISEIVSSNNVFFRLSVFIIYHDVRILDNNS
jgi:hypothetical protein